MNPARAKGLLVCVLISSLTGTTRMASQAFAIDNADCFTCHDDKTLVMTNATGKVVPLYVDKTGFQASVHGTKTCTTCHTDITDLPHAKKLKQVTCAQCHKTQTEVYLKSDHGRAMSQGVTEAPGCISCHGDSHKMLGAHNPESPVHHINVPSTCASCHAKTDVMEKFHLTQHGPVISYEKSVHGIALMQKGVSVSAVCTDCHGVHDISKSSNPQSKLHWQNLTATCGKCHDGIQRAYLRSVHGKAMLEGKRHAPVCTDCHGEHDLAAASSSRSPISSGNVEETCGQCHAAKRIVSKYRLPQNSVNSYLESYHGLSMQLGAVKAANCASCHSAHDILPSSDPLSSINPARLQKTCGKCHPGIGTRIAAATIHTGGEGIEEHVAVTYVRWFYYLLIVGVLGGMFLHNLVDFIVKLRDNAKKHQAENGVERMSVNERIQHFILILTFVVLVYSGFALKFPHAWWAKLFEASIDWRGVLHRVAAFLFCLLSIYHTVYIIFTKRGRSHLRALAIKTSDFTEFFGMAQYYLGLRPKKPSLGFYSYAEKAEYWALVWGSIIMVGTGVLLTWKEWTLQMFPQWVFDVATVIHYYEAILATFAIILWHFYFSIFDPDEYPMKFTWISGQESEADRHHRRPMNSDLK